jgi:hypothetical protein
LVESDGKPERLKLFARNATIDAGNDVLDKLAVVVGESGVRIAT